MKNFKFTFKTEAEYLSAKITGYIDEYKCVRMEIIKAEGWHLDFPLHSEEEYTTYLTKYVRKGDRIVRTYPSTTFYESKYSY